MNFYEAMKQRRSRYDLTAKSPIRDARIQEILTETITYTPSAFHSQSSRVVLLLGNQHHKFWSIVTETLRRRVPAEKFSSTAKKMEGFDSAYGTILFFEDMATVENLQSTFKSYADNFPIWSNQSAGMLQFATWTALAGAGLGASLQHYNPIIDDEVRQEFNISDQWKLLAQMPFGTPASQPQPLQYLPIEQRLTVLGDKND